MRDNERDGSKRAKISQYARRRRGRAAARSTACARRRRSCNFYRLFGRLLDAAALRRNTSAANSLDRRDERLSSEWRARFRDKATIVAFKLRARDLLTELYTIEDVAGVSRSRGGSSSGARFVAAKLSPPSSSSSSSSSARGGRARREWQFGQWSAPAEHGHISGYAGATAAIHPPSIGSARPPAVSTAAYDGRAEYDGYDNAAVAPKVDEPQPPAFGYTPPPRPPTAPPTAPPSLGVNEFQPTCEAHRFNLNIATLVFRRL